MNQATVPHPSKYFSLEFFEPSIVVVNLHGNRPGAMHPFVPMLESVLKRHLISGSEYHLILNPSPRKDDSFSAEDIDAIQLHMKSLAQGFRCRSSYFVMNDGLHFHINRAALEPFCSEGVLRVSSLGEAITRIEEDHGIEITFDSLPVSCC